MNIHAVVCAVALLLCLGSTPARAQSMKASPPPVAAPSIEASFQASDAVAVIRTTLPQARPAAVSGRARYRSAVMQLLHHTAEHSAPASTRDPVYDLLFRSPTSSGDFLSEFVDLSLLNDARAFVRRATTYRDERFTLYLDPFKPRCTIQIPLGRSARTDTQEP